jgi:hypothetical protein
MGELGDRLMESAIQQSILSIIDDTMQSARILHNLAQVIEEEELATANAAQLREAAVRCIDLIEITIEASVAETSPPYRESQIARDLSYLRDQILHEGDQA